MLVPFDDLHKSVNTTFISQFYIKDYKVWRIILHCCHGFADILREQRLVALALKFLRVQHPDIHFIIDDHLEHVYFEEDEAGRKLPIRADLLLMDGRGRLGAGDVAEATAVFEKAARYFPEDPRVYRAMADVHLVTAREAIDRAIASYARVEELRPDETLDKSRLAWELVALQARIAPVDLSPEQFERLTGSYGPRQVVHEGGELYYSRGDSPRAKLIPLTEMIFQHETLEWFRVRFDTDARGRISGITGLYRDGDRDENPRD